MSEKYIRTHFDDIKKYASVVESRIDDEYCTMDTVLKDNVEVLELCEKHKCNYILIDEQYRIDIKL